MNEDEGTVYGIRPHRPLTEAELELQRRVYGQLPITDPELLARIRHAQGAPVDRGEDHE